MGAQMSLTPTARQDAAQLLWQRRVSGAQYLQATALLDTLPPHLADAMVARYADIAGPDRRFYQSPAGRVLDSWNDAAQDMRRLYAELERSRPGVAFDDDALERMASHAARHCIAETSQERACAYALGHGARIPQGPRITSLGLWRRLRSPDWWRRQLRASLTRQCEGVFRRLGFVRAQRAPYVSDDALERVRAARAKSRRWMRETAALAEDTGETIPLEHIAEHSLANPRLRRGELMTRARGFQETATAAGHRCMMVTLTCPSAFHAWLKTGERNPQFNESNPRDGQHWLNTHWARARAALQRRDVLVYGIRAAEPHHDGCPHWHAILYTPPEHVETLRAVLSQVWLKDCADEPGAAEHRIRFTNEDPTRGSGVAYLAKYISKGIDGAGSVGSEASDESGRPVAEDAERVIAWARVWGIRQFAQVGGPAVTTWRELRRVRDPCDCPPLESLRLTTDHTDQGGPSWARFIATLGGIAAALPASRGLLDKAQPRRIDSRGRNVLRVTRWGELPAPMVVGLRLEWNGRIKRLPTRVHVWVLIFAPLSEFRLGPVAITVLPPGSPAGWTNPQETSQAPPQRSEQPCFASFGVG